MIFLCTNGRKKKIANSVKYLIDWDADCKSGIQKKVKNVLYDNWFADVVFEELLEETKTKADEMQNATPSQMKMLLTRLGENSKMAVTGDPLPPHARPAG